MRPRDEAVARRSRPAMSAGATLRKEGEACSPEGGHSVVGAPGSFDKTPSHRPWQKRAPRAPSRPAFPAAWRSPQTTGAAVDPVCLNSALPRRAGRASAYYRFFGRDYWPQRQLEGWYSAGPAVCCQSALPTAAYIGGMLLIPVRAGGGAHTESDGPPLAALTKRYICRFSESIRRLVRHGRTWPRRADLT